MRVTKEQIATWKASYRDIYKITHEGVTAYLKAPNRDVMGMASTKKPDQIAFMESIIKGCFLGGDPKIYQDDALFFGVCEKINQFCEFQKINIEKIDKDGKELWKISSGDKSCLIGHPLRKHVAAALMMKDQVAQAEYLLEECWVEGDEAFLHDDAYFLPLHDKVDLFITYKNVEVEKL